jgi:hypothetical protein
MAFDERHLARTAYQGRRLRSGGRRGARVAAARERGGEGGALRWEKAQGIAELGKGVAPWYAPDTALQVTDATPAHLRALG